MWMAVSAGAGLDGAGLLVAGEGAGAGTVLSAGGPAAFLAGVGAVGVGADDPVAFVSSARSCCNRL